MYTTKINNKHREIASHMASQLDRICFVVTKIRAITLKVCLCAIVLIIVFDLIIKIQCEVVVGLGLSKTPI